MNQSPSPEAPNITPFPPPAAVPPPLGGRPSLFSPELTAEICAAIRLDGVSDTAAGLLQGVSKTTLSRWKSDHEDFAVALGQARAQFEQARLRQIRSACKRDGSPDWRALAWLLQKSSPETYGPPPRRRARKEPEPEENNGQPVVTPEEMLRVQAVRARTLERINPKRPPGDGPNEQPAPDGSLVVPGVAPAENGTIRPETSVQPAGAAISVAEVPAANEPIRPETPTLPPREIAEQHRAEHEAARRAEDQDEADRRLLHYIMNDLPPLYTPSDSDGDDGIPGMWAGY